MSVKLCQVQKSINRAIAALGTKGKLSNVGSFLAFRIEDKERKITCYQATEIGYIAGSILADLKLSNSAAPISNGYWMDGVVINWHRGT